MTNQQRINALFTAMACVIDMKLNSDDLVEFELVSSLKEMSNDPMFDSLKQDGFDKNFFGISKSGNLFPTRKGENMLFGETVITKVVNKMQPKPVEKMTDNEVIETFINTGNQICQRIPNGVAMQKKVYTNYNKIYDAAACVVENINSFVNSLPSAEPVVEVVEKPKATRKKKEVVTA